MTSGSGCDRVCDDDDEEEALAYSIVVVCFELSV